MYKTTLSILALALSLSAATAFAAIPTFERVDADKNGVISMDEAATAAISEKLFSRFDKDQNSQLSMEEYQALVKATQ